MKKIIALALALCMLLGCSAALAEDTVYHIGILQQLQHVALDAATQGFMDVLVEKLGEDKVVFDYQNASNETANCATIANAFVANEVDLIMANATTALQTSAEATTTIPIVGTSITDYASALGIPEDEWTGSTGINVSGASDLALLSEQAAIITELFPEAKTVGLLYCSAEPNSVFQIKSITPYIEEAGLTTIEYAFADSNDLTAVVQKACSEIDVLYIPTDNEAAANTELIYNVVSPAKIPVVAGEEGICAGCGVATLSISYYELGRTTGEMAYDVLVNGADISTMEIRYAPQTRKYNARIAEELGVEIPEGYEAIEE